MHIDHEGTGFKKMHRTKELYRCGFGEHWRRQIGDVNPNAFARQIGGCEVWKFYNKK